jgi:hypothetical protein
MLVNYVINDNDNASMNGLGNNYFYSPTIVIFIDLFMTGIEQSLLCCKKN